MDAERLDRRAAPIGLFNAAAFLAALFAFVSLGGSAWPLAQALFLNWLGLLVVAVFAATTVLTTGLWLRGVRPDDTLRATVWRAAAWGSANAILFPGLLVAVALGSEPLFALAVLAVGAALGAVSGAILGALDCALFRLAPGVRTGH